MNGFILMIPLLVIRFGFLGLLDKEALKKAAHFAPVEGKERIAYVSYQLANLSLFIWPLFTQIKVSFVIFILGIGAYVWGALLLLFATIYFVFPRNEQLKIDGIYRFSRNPMYLGYFFYFLGCVLLTQSKVLAVSLFFFQLSAHWIILAEERWCQVTFGDEYQSYQKRVRRYM